MFAVPVIMVSSLLPLFFLFFNALFILTWKVLLLARRQIMENLWILFRRVAFRPINIIGVRLLLARFRRRSLLVLLRRVVVSLENKEFSIIVTITTFSMYHSTSLGASPVTGSTGATAWCDTTATPTRSETTSSVVNSLSAVPLCV